MHRVIMALLLRKTYLCIDVTKRRLHVIRIARVLLLQ